MKRTVFSASLLIVQLFGFGQIGGSQYYYHTAEAFRPSLISIDGEAFVNLPQLKKIESATVPVQFNLTGGTIKININGVIDRIAPSAVIFNLTAQEIENSRLNIFLIHNSEHVRYKVDGSAFGFYTGPYEESGFFLIRTKFRISAPGYPSYILDIPIHIQISPAGIIHYERSFVDGTAYVHNAPSKRPKVKLAKN